MTINLWLELVALVEISYICFIVAMTFGGEEIRKQQGEDTTGSIVIDAVSNIVMITELRRQREILRLRMLAEFGVNREVDLPATTEGLQNEALRRAEATSLQYTLMCGVVGRAISEHGHPNQIAQKLVGRRVIVRSLVEFQQPILVVAQQSDERNLSSVTSEAVIMGSIVPCDGVDEGLLAVRPDDRPDTLAYVSVLGADQQPQVAVALLP